MFFTFKIVFAKHLALTLEKKKIKYYLHHLNLDLILN